MNDANATDLVKAEAKNTYYDIVSALSPGEIIGRFADTAPTQVQDAVRTTIVGLLGSASSFALETATVMTGERLANLMFQLQMTGYMFKNAEYRISLAQSLGGGTAPTASALPPSSSSADGDDDASAAVLDPLPEVSGQVRVDIGGTTVSVDADAYMAELRKEVEELRGELAKVEADRETTPEQQDLLAFVAAMPEQQMGALTSDITDDVLDCMKRLVYSIMRSMGTSQIEPGTLLQQSGSAMTQLCLWQLVIGYNLRELEVRDQLQRQLAEGDD